MVHKLLHKLCNIAADKVFLFFFFNQKLLLVLKFFTKPCFGYSLEDQGTSNEYPQYIYSGKNKSTKVALKRGPWKFVLDMGSSSH